MPYDRKSQLESPAIGSVPLLLLCGSALWTTSALCQEKLLPAPKSEVTTNSNPGIPSSSNSTPKTSAGSPGISTGIDSHIPVSVRPFQLTLPRAHLLEDWLGLLSRAEDLGISPTLTFVTDIAGNVTGGKSQGVTHADNLGLDLSFDLNKLTGLDGASFLVSMSQRSGNSLSKEHVGNIFTIQQVYGGQTFHLIDLAYQQDLLDDRVEFRLGRIAVGDDFLVSQYSYLYMQNGFCGNPVGIFFNSPGMTAYPNATWGTRLKFRPTNRAYIMGGLYNGDPSIRAIDNNGADMSLNGPVFAIAEAGYQLNGLPGDSPLLGDYKAGVWYDNSLFTDFETAGFGRPPLTKRGNWGVYLMVDQILIPLGDRASSRGLGVFGSFLASPDESISQLPWFFTAGISSRGVCASRPRDMVGFGVVCGVFSSALRDSQQRAQVFDPTVGAQDYEAVLEWTYRFYFRKGALFFQPDIQYVIRPGGTGNIDNALVLGCQVGLNF